MTNIIHFLALFTLTATAVQFSLFRRWWQGFIVAAFMALATYWFYPLAITLGKNDLLQWLANAPAMQNLAVILVLEAIFMLVLALMMLRDMYLPLSLPWSLLLYLQFFPAVTTIGVLCFYQVSIYQQALPYDFALTAIVYGGGVALLLMLLAAFIKLLVPLRVLRHELKLAMHAAQIVLASAISVLTAKYPYAGVSSALEWKTLGMVAVIVVVFFFIGYWRYQYTLKKLY